MNFYKRHIGDYLKDTAHLSLLEHGVYARLLDVYYTREAAIPDDQAARLVCARSPEETEALRNVLREFFTRDGDVWVQARCEAEIQSANGGTEDEPKPSRTTKAERQKRYRERRKSLYEALRNHGITMPFDASIEALEDALLRVAVTPRVTPKHNGSDANGDVTEDVTATATRSQTPEARSQSEIVIGASNAVGARVTRFDDDVVPLNEADWAKFYGDEHGIVFDPANVHDRKKFMPLAKAWVNAGVSVGQMRAAIIDAQGRATEAIAYLPAYVDRVLANQGAPRASPRSAENAAILAGLAGNPLGDEYGNDPGTIDVDATIVG
ncbi:YdaU family protein [Pandoraea sp. XJJ-1]|uniref:YdaU family protein n=1 Tax=Pandoraea sp. XJJ-1 TaxID=3002643 RepID=UPI00227EB489|nr:YdaU family protein [Pandoraea sp. XJJ-1]WAL81497.1 YdaU family protein [Pandoraea sp. XJJ-1]